MGKCEDRIFEERDVQFNLGEGEDSGIIKGVEIALEKFKNKEHAKLKIKSKYAFGKNGKSEFNIPPDTDVIYEVELQSFEKVCKQRIFKFIVFSFLLRFFLII